MEIEIASIIHCDQVQKLHPWHPICRPMALKMKFVQISDPHLLAPGQLLYGNDPEDRFARCLDDIARWQSDAEFIVITGDIADIGDCRAYDLLKRMIRGYPIPVHLMMGNHDIRENMYKSLPNLPRDPNGFVQYRLDTDQGVMLFLDTSKDGVDAHEGEYCARRQAWLANELHLAGAQPTFLFMHHPPFQVGMPIVDDIQMQEPNAFAETLQEAHNIRHAFFGHIHKTVYANWRGIPFTSLPSLNHQNPLVPDSVPIELSNEPPAYAVITITEQQITVVTEPFMHRGPMPSEQP